MTNKSFFLKAIISLCPNCQFTSYDEDYERLVWDDENSFPKPTLEEIEAEAQRLQTEYENNEYQRLRAAEYPDFHEYLDGIVKSNSEQIQTYINSCLAVKAKYPKP
jgi:hypothetical protein